MKTLYSIALVLMIIGGINWGLWGLFQVDLVAYIFGSSTDMAARVVYVLVGVAALIGFGILKPICNCTPTGFTANK